MAGLSTEVLFKCFNVGTLLHCPRFPWTIMHAKSFWFNRMHCSWRCPDMYELQKSQNDLRSIKIGVASLSMKIRSPSLFIFCSAAMPCCLKKINDFFKNFCSRESTSTLSMSLFDNFIHHPFSFSARIMCSSNLLKMIISMSNPLRSWALSHSPGLRRVLFCK